ncbi:MAG TPA: transglutaminase domain-containing protein [Rhodanobacteraceae bacterium]|nr:transglutaminase domain-containing protein [Rhodanobacteraceae bacterium]
MVLLALPVAIAATPAAAAAAPAPGTEPPVTAIVTLIDDGQFAAAEARIAAALQAPGLSAASRTALQFQRERMRRIRHDFSLDADAVKAAVRRRIPDLTDAEFRRWMAHGLFEHMAIDGDIRYFRRSPGNLFRLSAEARARRAEQTPFADSGLEQVTDYHRKVIREALASGKSSVAPQRVKVTQTLTVDADAVPAGKTVRAWIPYPRAIPGQQEDIRFEGSEPAQHRIAPESALQRTVYMEKAAQAGKPTVFSVSYEVTLYSQYHAIDADEVVPAKITPALAPFVAERPPHVVFTQPMQVFSRQVVGDTSNPYRIAQRIYAAVDEIPWAGAREYSTLSNISDYTLHAGHGDCGEQTLLLITLMRMNGIPARWQSGWTFTTGDYNNIHDWAEIYLAPYGWVPVDVTYGRLDSQDPSLKWFYLGGLDNFRIAFNDSFARDFVPAKRHFRSDTVDSQRGEVEWDGGNLYYDTWDYDFAWKILPANQRRDDK